MIFPPENLSEGSLRFFLPMHLLCLCVQGGTYLTGDCMNHSLAYLVCLQVLVFLNTFLALNEANELVVIAACGDQR